MPAAAVIPAPIAYTNVVAVKKLVVEGGIGLCDGGRCKRRLLLRRCDLRGNEDSGCVLFGEGVFGHSCYCEEIRVFQAVF